MFTIGHDYQVRQELTQHLLSDARSNAVMTHDEALFGSRSHTTYIRRWAEHIGPICHDGLVSEGPFIVTQSVRALFIVTKVNNELGLNAHMNVNFLFLYVYVVRTLTVWLWQICLYCSLYEQISIMSIFKSTSYIQKRLDFYEQLLQTKIALLR